MTVEDGVGEWTLSLHGGGTLTLTVRDALRPWPDRAPAKLAMVLAAMRELAAAIDGQEAPRVKPGLERFDDS